MNGEEEAGDEEKEEQEVRVGSLYRCSNWPQISIGRRGGKGQRGGLICESLSRLYVNNREAEVQGWINSALLWRNNSH